MKAMIINALGGPEMFTAAEVADPVMGPGQVLVRVAATSVNPVDTLLRTIELPFSPPVPAILHGDVAGIVEAVAPDVTGFRPGDEVYGCAGGVAGEAGALAELMAVDANLIAHKPKSLTMAQAAALPLVAITAWEGLIRAGVKMGDTVLVQGATGGVAHVAIQLAKHWGAKVFATGSSDEKLAIATGLGADEAINYRTASPEAIAERYSDGRGFDVVFDTVSGANLVNSFLVAKHNGHVVATVALGPIDLTVAHLKGLSLHVVFMLIPLITGRGREAHGRILQRIADLADGGALRPLIDPRRFRIDQVADAHAHLESGKAIGKIVLEW